VLLESRAIDLILKSSYSRVIVDEYQDCSRDQHAWVTAIARLMPAVVLGDPLQTVFDFDGHRLNWQDDVCSAFPETYALTTPWRWKRAGAPQLGVWVTQLRQKLEANESIELTDLPDGVTHVVPKTPALRREQQQKEVRRLARIGRVLVIGSSHAEYQRFEFARLTHGVTVVETVELREMMALSQKLNLAKPDEALAKLVDFAHLVMTGVLVKPFHKRIATLRAGRGTKAPSASEDAALQLLRDPTHKRAVRLLRAFHNTSGNRLFRPTLFFAALSSLEHVADGRHVTLEQAARAERDVRRHQERSAGQVAIGSTLLLKGLEADACMILDADSLKKCHLYVALTRGTCAVSIWSRTMALQPL
jgi:DNA helicase-2/ATP-dependent DNA helicase PcrA